MELCGLLFDPFYPPELEKHNKSYACLVVRKTDKAVLATSVVDRGALLRWYDSKRREFGEDHVEYVIASMSIIGTLEGVIKNKQAMKDIKNAQDVN